MVSGKNVWPQSRKTWNLCSELLSGRELDVNPIDQYAQYAARVESNWEIDPAGQIPLVCPCWILKSETLLPDTSPLRRANSFSAISFTPWHVASVLLIVHVIATMSMSTREKQKWWNYSLPLPFADNPDAWIWVRSWYVVSDRITNKGQENGYAGLGAPSPARILPVRFWGFHCLAMLKQYLCKIPVGRRWSPCEVAIAFNVREHRQFFKVQSTLFILEISSLDCFCFTDNSFRLTLLSLVESLRFVRWGFLSFLVFFSHSPVLRCMTAKFSCRSWTTFVVKDH